MLGNDGPVAFVLGGGGVLGASEVGMLAALLDRGIRPDLIVGTSVGAINGALVAADPTGGSVDRLTELWCDLARGDVFGGSLLAQTATLVRTGTHLQAPGPLRRLLADQFGDAVLEDLAVRFQCVAASIERATEHWFDSGSVVDAVLASSAVPGLLAPVRIGDEHYLDGGLVAFEIARRHRFTTTMAALPDDVTVHVLPAGGEPMGFTDRRQFRYRDFRSVPGRIRAAQVATEAYFESVAGS